MFQHSCFALLFEKLYGKFADRKKSDKATILPKRVKTLCLSKWRMHLHPIITEILTLEGSLSPHFIGLSSGNL